MSVFYGHNDHFFFFGVLLAASETLFLPLTGVDYFFGLPGFLTGVDATLFGRPGFLAGVLSTLFGLPGFFGVYVTLRGLPGFF